MSSEGRAIHDDDAPIRRVVVVHGRYVKRVRTVWRAEANRIPDLRIEAPCERFGHDHRIAPDGFTHCLPAVAGRLEHERAVRQQHTEIAGAGNHKALFERQLTL